MPSNDAHFSGEGHLIEGEIEGDLNKTIRSIVCDADGHLIIDLDASTITIGTVDQGDPNTLANAWPIEITDGLNVLGTISNPLVTTGTFTPASASTAIITAVTVTTISTPLLAANVNRKGFTVQSKTVPFYLALSATVTTSLYSAYLLKLNEYERNNYTGPVSAILDSGSTTILVTELI